MVDDDSTHTQIILHGDYHDDDDTHLDGTAHRFLCEMQAMEPFCHDLQPL